jgi:hypothetical protein
MRWQLGRRSENVEDARRSGGIGLGGLSAGGVLLAVVASYFLGIDPMQMLGIMAQLQGDLPVDSQQSQAPPADDQGANFVRAILGEALRVLEDRKITALAVADAGRLLVRVPHHQHSVDHLLLPHDDLSDFRPDAREKLTNVFSIAGTIEHNAAGVVREAVLFRVGEGGGFND